MSGSQRTLLCLSLVTIAALTSTNILLPSRVVEDNYKVDDEPKQSLRILEKEHILKISAASLEESNTARVENVGNQIENSVSHNQNRRATDILDELKPLNVIAYQAFHNPNPPLDKDQQLPLTLLVHHREFFAGCHSFERFFNPKWQTIIVVEADMAEQYRLQELAQAAAKTSPAIHIALVDQEKTMTGEWLGRLVALKIMNFVDGAQRTPLMLSTQCDIQPLPEFHALHRSYDDVVFRMVHLFLEEDHLNQQYQKTNVNEYKHMWGSAPLDKATCKPVFAKKARPLLTMNVAMMETLPNTETLKGSKFHSLEAGLANSWETNYSRPDSIAFDQPWMSDISTWVEDHFNLYNVSLLEKIVSPLANVAPTVSEGPRAIPNILCQRGWKAVRLNDEPVFYDFQKVQLSSRGDTGSYALFQPSKYNSVSMDWLLETSVVNLAKISSPLGCQREYQRLRMFANVDVESACVIAKHHFQSNHLPSRFWNNTVNDNKPLVVAIMSLYGYELYVETPQELTFLSVPLYHTVHKSFLDGRLNHTEEGLLQMPGKEDRHFIKINRNSVLKKEAFFDEMEFNYHISQRDEDVRRRQSQDAKAICKIVDKDFASLPEVKALSDSCSSDGFSWLSYD